MIQCTDSSLHISHLQTWLNSVFTSSLKTDRRAKKGKFNSTGNVGERAGGDR